MSLRPPLKKRSGPAPSAPEAAGDGAIARRNLLRADADLTGAVDAAIAKAARLAGAALVCRAGCSECCIGPVPITRLDAWRLREGLAALRQSAPERAGRIVERARAAVETMRRDSFLERHADLPCPVLDPVTQTCDLYAHRPVSCRAYGPPVRFNGQDLLHCRLCFATSEPQAVEACRVEPDRDGLEQAILKRLKREDGEGREMLIAWAVAGAPPDLPAR